MCVCVCVSLPAESGDGVSVEAVKARLERSWALTSAKGAEASVSGTASQSHDDTQRTLDPEQLTQNIDQAIKIRSLLARNTEVRCVTWRGNKFTESLHTPMTVQNR